MEQKAGYELLREKHVKYCLRCLSVLPQVCEGLDTTRLVVAFFAVSALDHLDALIKINSEKEKLIDWLYTFQVQPEKNESSPNDYGFRSCTTCSSANSSIYDKPHAALTYAALCTLIILGDDLSRVDKKNIVTSLRKLQLPDGSFRPMNVECESDMRFVYCAACICYILQDWSGMDVEKTVAYIKLSRNYDGGIGQGPGLESHGGSTFCAIATLWMMGRLENTFTGEELKHLKRWLVFRQEHGFHGRPNKPDDSCYSFWVGATLKLLNCYHFVNYPEVLKFVLSTQDDVTGGIAKWVDYVPDMLHTYLGISGLFLYDEGSVPRVHPALNISQRAADFLHSVHQKWGLER